MTVDTQELLATRGSIAPLSPSRLQEIRDRAFHRMDDRATRGQHIHITANEAIELVAAAQALNDAQAKFDAQAAEIERLKKALRVAVLALAHATEEHGKVYEPAYDAVQIALYGDPDAT